VRGVFLLVKIKVWVTVKLISAKSGIRVES